MGSFIAGDTSSQTTSATTLPGVTWPVHGVDDLALLAHASDGTTTATIDSGFTSVANIIDTNLRAILAKRIGSVMTGSESGDLTISCALANRQSAALGIWRGFTDVQQAVNQPELSATAQTSHTCPTITPQLNGSGFVLIYMDRVSSGTTTSTPPAGFTKRAEFGTGLAGGTYVCIADDLTGTRGLSAFTPANWVVTVASTSALIYLVELAPTVQTAAASLTETVTLTAAATSSKNVAATLAPVASLAAAATVTDQATASLTAAATLSATAAVVPQSGVDAQFGAAASISAAVAGTRPGAAALTATAATAATATPSRQGAAALTATTSASAGARTDKPAAAALTVAAGINAAASTVAAPVDEIDAALSTSAAITAGAVGTRPADAGTAAAAVIEAAAEIVRHAAADLVLTATVAVEAASAPRFTHRPDIGATPRISSGATARPNTGKTPRPNTGTTPRP